VLSIADGSPDSPTIRKAFRRACLKSHPDKIARVVGTAEAERRFLVVTQAFETASGFRATGELPEPDVGPDDANEMHPEASDSENEEERRKEKKRKRKQEEQNRKAEAEAKRARKQEAWGRKEWWGSDYPEEEDEDCYSEEECEGEAHGRPRWEGRGKQGAQWNSGDREEYGRAKPQWYEQRRRGTGAQQQQHERWKQRQWQQQQQHGAYYSEEEDEEDEDRGQAHWEGRVVICSTFPPGRLHFTMRLEFG
jgi:hypothetical protein